MAATLNGGQMSGLLKTTIINLFLLVFFYGCGNRESASKVDYKNTFLSRANIDLEKIKLNTTVFKDLDSDGIVDAHDNDIDGDGFHNLVDEYPFDNSIWGEDKNFNGIPDIVDFSFDQNVNANSVECQESLFREKNILIVNDDLESIDTEILLVCDLLSKSYFLKNPIQNIQIIALRSEEKSTSIRRGDYLRNWKVISLFFGDHSIKSEVEFITTFIHEVFHSFESEENLIKLEKIVDGELLSIKHAQGGDEAFADNLTLAFLCNESLELEKDRFLVDESFCGTEKAVEMFELAL